MTGKDAAEKAKEAYTEAFNELHNALSKVREAEGTVTQSVLVLESAKDDFFVSVARCTVAAADLYAAGGSLTRFEKEQLEQVRRMRWQPTA